MRGSVEKFDPGVKTELKKLSVLALIAPSARPVLLSNERIRPLRAVMNWVGPTAPIVSGGQPEQSLKLAAVKLIVELTVCCPSGEIGEPEGVRTAGAALAAGRALDAGGSRRGATWRTWARPAWTRSRAMIW